MAEELTAGYAHRRKGVSSYMGILKAGRKTMPAWTCPHDHITTVKAKACAEAELERRRQGASEVFTLLHCKPCRKWWEDIDVDAVCPRCDVPLERVKLAVVSRRSALDGE